jgi:hypothetical protein
MPYTLLEMTAFRRRENTEALKREAKLGSAQLIYLTVAGVALTVETETGDGTASIKLKSLRKAVELIQAKGFNLPSIHFKLTGAQGVENVAFMGDGAGNRLAVVYLGPKFTTKNPRQNVPTTITGGLGGRVEGPRGVANQEYDGTTRWFGNPKLLAQGTTIVVHELGHVLHEQMDEQNFWACKQSMMGPNGDWIDVCNQVSDYAGKGAVEFVAEVFAGIIAGRTYGGGVRDAYRALGGPEVVGFF